MNKKGVELTMQTVVIALLVLLVLGVLIFLLFGGATTFTKGTACQPKDCTSEQSCEAGKTVAPWKCPNPDDKCCVTVGT